MRSNLRCPRLCLRILQKKNHPLLSPMPNSLPRKNQLGCPSSWLLFFDLLMIYYFRSFCFYSFIFPFQRINYSTFLHPLFCIFPALFYTPHRPDQCPYTNDLIIFETVFQCVHIMFLRPFIHRQTLPLLLLFNPQPFSTYHFSAYRNINLEVLLRFKRRRCSLQP